MSYWRFAAMIATSTVVMYGLMYLNTYAWEHVFWSETRFWMALLMGATMAVIMLSYMMTMYKSRAINLGIFAGAIAVFGLSLWLVRSQATVDDVDFMRAMIPHHSIAILTANRAQISDPRVSKLADEIIDAQEKEIAEMRYLVSDLTEREDAGTGRPDDAIFPARGETVPRIVSVEEALSSVDVPSLDPSPMTQAAVDRALGAGPSCVFRYVSEGRPVLAARFTPDGEPVRGVVTLAGDLVLLEAVGREGAGYRLEAGYIRIVVAPGAEEGREAEMTFAVGEVLRAGYGGFHECLE